MPERISATEIYYGYHQLYFWDGSQWLRGAGDDNPYIVMHSFHERSLDAYGVDALTCPIAILSAPQAFMLDAPQHVKMRKLKYYRDCSPDMLNQLLPR